MTCRRDADQGPTLPPSSRCAVGKLLVVAIAVAGLFAPRLAIAGVVLGVLDSGSGILVPNTASGSAATAAPVVVTGTIKMTGSFVFGPEIPTSTKASASSSIFASDAVFSVDTEVFSTPSTRTGNIGSITLTSPYYWTLGASADKVTVVFRASATTADGTTYVYGVPVTIALPKSGASTTFSHAAGF